MMIPGLSDAQQDQVVQSLRGSTLVELLRASVQAGDLSTLQAIERNGYLDQALLTPNHVNAQADYRRQAVMDSSLTPMLDSLGQVLAFQGDFEPPVKNKVEQAKVWTIDLEIAKLLSRHVASNMADLEKKIQGGQVPHPGSINPALRVRQHLCALGALAVAADQPELVERINWIDPQALFTRLHSNLIERDIGVHAISPWGLAMRLKRSEIVIGQFNPKNIEEALAIDTHYDSEYDIKATELLTSRNDVCPSPDALTMWLIRSVAQLSPDDCKKLNPWETTDDSEGKQQELPGETIIKRLCEKEGEWSPIAQEVFNQAREIFQTNLKSCIESLSASSESKSLDLLGQVLRECVDWDVLDKKLKSAYRGKFDLKFIPYEHPLGIVTDSLSGGRYGSNTPALDTAMELTLRVMQEKGVLDEILTNGVSLDDDKLCFAHEIAGRGLVKSLGFMLRSGMDVDLKNQQGMGLLEFCEKNHKDGPALPLLRAHAAAKSVDELLSRHKHENHFAVALGS